MGQFLVFLFEFVKYFCNFLHTYSSQIPSLKLYFKLRKTIAKIKLVY